MRFGQISKKYQLIYIRRYKQIVYMMFILKGIKRISKFINKKIKLKSQQTWTLIKLKVYQMR